MIRGVAMGEVFKNESFDTFEVSAGNRKAFEACKRVALGERQGVVLIGSNGRGKSHLLEALAREFDRIHSYVPAQETSLEMAEVPPLQELMDMQFDDSDTSQPYLSPCEITKHAHVEFWPTLDLFAALRKDSLSGDGQIVERCMRCDLLVLDDIGREKKSDFIDQEFHRIIDYRYRHRMKIAVATNLDRAQIAGRYGAHTISRWANMVVDISGDDYRLRGGK